MNWNQLLFWKKKRTHREGHTPRPEPNEERRLQAEIDGLDRQLELLDILCEGHSHTSDTWLRSRSELRAQRREKVIALKRWKREGLG